LKIRDNYKNATSTHINIISWVFNDKKKIKCLINLGVDGIVTDKPKMLREIALDMGKILH
jgi:glycerophosphoryl diester phosphodiesterase